MTHANALLLNGSAYNMQIVVGYDSLHRLKPKRGLSWFASIFRLT